MLKFFVVILSFISLNTWGQSDFCSTRLDDMPVLAGGREKPLYILARESMLFMTGKAMYEAMEPTEVFCRLSFQGFGVKHSLSPQIKVDHVDAKKLLAMKVDEKSIDVKELINKKNIIGSELERVIENNSYRKELLKIDQRLNAYVTIVSGEAWTVPVITNREVSFVPLREFMTQERVDQNRTGMNPLVSMFAQAKKDYIDMKGENFLLELKYQKLNPFLWALILSLISLCTFVLFKSQRIGIFFASLTIFLQISAMIMRIMISGRAPVTNMYETVMFSGFGALILGAFISFIRRDKSFVLAGLSFNIMSLLMMKFANGMLDPSISPLVPVLRDNLWLSTHVTTVILSYAAFALSWLLANGALIRGRFFRLAESEKRYMSDLIYTCLKFGVVLLASGIILGGIWADYSWGRFWGWDPKETWSLIVLLIYMAILHGRSTSWIRTERFIPMVAFAFLTVMMAWFGVNYILASGLHSYGFSEGGVVFLGTFFLSQIVVLLICLIKPKTKNDQESGLAQVQEVIF
ncbi:MAG: cytochrome c biogenesis protein CcsA [Bdellovibrionales bacterium]|nr:cytochrome c biogenesis protein CcsA [Bdellovibrionales bacterium]